VNAEVTAWGANGYTPVTVKVEMPASTARILSEFAFNGVLEMIRNMEPGGTEAGREIAAFIETLYNDANIRSCVTDMTEDIS
jgi:hypothetical protein